MPNQDDSPPLTQDSRFEALLREAAETDVVPAASPVVGERLSDRYEIQRRIGAGAMGEVFKARHLLTGRTVALKWLFNRDTSERDPSHQRVQREARAATKIRHPNVVEVLDAGSHRGGHYLVMDLLEGMPLGDYLKRESPSLADKLGLMMYVLRGVEAAHVVGVVHRDLKPDNIFVCQNADGSVAGVKVLDFGVSKVDWDANATQDTMNSTGVVAGTPGYMAPEQARGDSGIDGRVDIYACSAILYEMVTGRRPIEADTYNQLLYRLWHEDPVPLADMALDLPAALGAAIMRGLSRAPSARFSHVAELAEQLEPYCSVRWRDAADVLASTDSGEARFGALVENGRAAHSPTWSATPSGLTKANRRTWDWAFAALVVLVAGGGAAWFLLGSTSPSAPKVLRTVPVQAVVSVQTSKRSRAQDHLEYVKSPPAPAVTASPQASGSLPSASAKDSGVRGASRAGNTRVGPARTSPQTARKMSRRRRARTLRAATAKSSRAASTPELAPATPAKVRAPTGVVRQW